MFIYSPTSNIINQLNIRPCFLAQKVTKGFSENESTQRFTNKDNTDKFDDLATNELFYLFFTNTKPNSQTRKSKKETSKTHV